MQCVCLSPGDDSVRECEWDAPSPRSLPLLSQAEEFSGPHPNHGASE